MPTLTQVHANPDIIDFDWWRDHDRRAEVHTTIRNLKRDGFTHSEIATRVGVSQRCVARTLSPSRPATGQKCGADRTENRGACTQPVKVGRTRCVYHDGSRQHESRRLLIVGYKRASLEKAS